MDTRKLVHENKKVIKDIIDNNKKVKQNGISAISDQQDILLKDGLKYLEKKPPRNMKEANDKYQEAVDYYKPNWRTEQKQSGKTFSFSVPPTAEEIAQKAKEEKQRAKRWKKMTPAQIAKEQFPWISI